MTFRFKVTYYPLDMHGMRYTRKPRTGYVRARTAAAAQVKAEEKFDGEIVSVE